MAQREFFITREGLAKLQAELDHLYSVGRQEVAEKIKRAREIGGTANNAEYDNAKDEQAFVEGRILTLENIISRAVIIESPSSSSEVDLGSKVLIRDQDGKLEQYTIVGSAEANPIEGKISNESLVGKALLGRKAGDKIEVIAPAGKLKLLVMEVT